MSSIQDLVEQRRQELEKDRMQEEVAKQDVLLTPQDLVGQPGGYRKVRLQRVIRANGRILEPKPDGYFYPECKEDEDQLEYYVTVGAVEPALK